MREHIKPVTGLDGGETSRMLIAENCRELIKSLQQLEFSESRPNDAATEPHEISHQADCLRYYCVSRPVPAKAPERELTDGEKLQEIKKKAIYAASRNGRSRRF